MSVLKTRWSRLLRPRHRTNDEHVVIVLYSRVVLVVVPMAFFAFSSWKRFLLRISFPFLTHLHGVSTDKPLNDVQVIITMIASIEEYACASRHCNDALAFERQGLHLQALEQCSLALRYFPESVVAKQCRERCAAAAAADEQRQQEPTVSARQYHEKKLEQQQQQQQRQQRQQRQSAP